MNLFIKKSLIAKHKTLWSDKSFIISAMVSFLFFIGSFFINYSAVKYAIREVGNSTTDILLETLPVVNTDIIFSYGVLLFVIFITFLFIIEPKIIPFTLKSIALFIVVRSVFVIMTHLGPVPERIATRLDDFSYFTSGADLFFSGHTGLPFLMALLFWEKRYLRWFFLFCSLVAAIAVILGHLHYTIDVFSAPFIAYGIYHIARKFFLRDYELFIYESSSRLNF